MHIHLFIKILLVLSLFTFIEATQEENLSNDEVTTSIKDNSHIEALLIKKKDINKELSEDNIWSKIYSSYRTYQELQKQKQKLEKHISTLEKNKTPTNEEKTELEKLQSTKKTLVDKLLLLKEYEKDPFKRFLTPPVIGKVPNVENPFAIIGALSYKEKLHSDQKDYDSRYLSLKNIVEKYKDKEKIILNLIKIEPDNEEYLSILADTQDQLKTFNPVLEIFNTTESVYTKKIDEIELDLKHGIKREAQKAMIIGAIILFFLFLLFFSKYLVRKYMSNNERFYTINKALNISFFSMLLITLLFAYIENVSYLVTILGFASAGIAIAMKDWFMSLMGWFTLVLGGAIHVGDRVRFVRDGVEYVGDIVDISMLRMTMHEDITLTTFMVNRRAGRMVFIPNNFIFTDMISNYSHAGLKTVWDGIDFVVTFDSDVHKATIIAKEISKKYSKGYTDITRKQLNKLRSQYGIRNTNVEPRIFTHIEPHGMKISVWYLTNSFATMTLRSTISIEIITRIQAEEGISLAFPTQSIYMDKNVPKPEPLIEDGPIQGTLL
ncbi:MAG TPA: mechanosensitive ion channel [Sulfurovum sp.]|nr:mechanosensitive ion channel [Sulfurovum sp.]